MFLHNKKCGWRDTTNGSAAVSSSIARPCKKSIQSPMGRGRGRSEMFSLAGQQHNQIYALLGHHNLESSTNMVTGILSVFSLDIYALIDPDSTLSYIFPFIASKCCKKPEVLCQPVEVSTPWANSQ